MAAALAYLDTSAFVKLPLLEPERGALRQALAEHDGLVSSALLRVEAERACSRLGDGMAERAQSALRGVALIPMDDAILRAAAALEPPALRTLDAIHLASALSLGGDLAAVFTYDVRLAEAAASAGVTVRSPS